MAGNFEFYAEMGLNAGAAISELSRVSSTAETTTKNLDALHTALESVAKHKGPQGAQAQQLQTTLGLYQQLATAVASYGRSLKTINSTDLNNGVRKTATSLDHMKKALEGVDKTSKEDFDAKKRTLDLYKQMAGASKTQADTLRSEADAIKAVAQAERTRQQTARSAATPSGGGGTDAWGVTTDERQQRQRAQVVVQAEKEMEAAFESRAREQLKANGQMDRQQAAVHEAAAATKAHTAATSKNSAAQGDQERALASTRYALYEIAASYAAVSAAALALPVASTRAAIEMEAQFAHVERTTQAAAAPLNTLRRELIDLSTEIPITFEELSKIASLGAQMGIAESSLHSFTDTVAQFAATTNVTAEQAAMSFGRLANMMHLNEGDYHQLGSAISELGTASVATESEILNIAESIATTANMAGFSAAEVSGLSTAMASLRIRPEMARGAMQRIFAKINVAVGDGTEQLAEYARMLGVSEQAAADMWRHDPSQFFLGINTALSKMNDNVERSQFIREGLGVTNIRDVELLARLSNGLEVYADSLTLAQDAYARGDYLERESGVIFEKTGAMLERLANAFKGFLAEFGSQNLAPINLAAELLTSLLNALRSIPSAITAPATLFGLLVGGVAALRAAMALAIASMRAFRLVMREMGVAGTVNFRLLGAEAAKTFGIITGGSATAAAGTAGLTAANSAATASTLTLRSATAATWGLMKAHPIGMAITAVSLLGTSLVALAQSHENAAEKAKAHADEFISSMGGAEALMAALREDAAAFESGDQTKVYGYLNVQMEETKAQAEDTASTLYSVLNPAHEEQAEVVDRTTTAYKQNVGAIGEVTSALMERGLVDALAEAGLSAEELQNLVDQGFDLSGTVDLWKRDADAAVESVNEWIKATREANRNTGFSERQYNDPFIEQAADAASTLVENLVSVDEGLESVRTTAFLEGELGLLDETENGAEDAKDAVEALNDEMESLLDSMFLLIDAEAAVFKAMEDLGSSLDENGPDFNTWTEEGRANLGAFRDVLDAMWADIMAQVEAGSMSMDEAALTFGEQYESLLAQLADSGVDTAQFDYFREYIDTLFETPVSMDIDVDPAFQSLEAVSEYAHTVLSNIAAQSDGMRGALASWGAGVVSNVRTRHGAGVKPPKPVRTPGAGTAGGRDIQLQALEAARARAEQERLARAAEAAAKETEKQAKEQKKAADEAKKLREEIADAKDEGRIFEEIIKGLGEAFKDTLYQFNNFQTNRDSVESHLISMRDAAQQSAEQVRSLREEHRKLRQEASEDRVEARQAESFASVARRYGDTERVVDYTTQAKGARESAAEKDRLAREALKEADALNKNRLALTGYSEQAIKNRGDVRALQERMTDLILAYAETGATTEEVTRYAEGLRRKFIDQLTQMGYNRRDAERLSEVFVQLKTDIDRIPREVRIQAKARVKEAEAALRNVARGRTATIDLKPRNKNFVVDGKLAVQSIEAARTVKASSLEVGRVTDYGNGITSNWARSGGGLIPGASGGPSNRDNRLVIGPGGPEGTIRTGEFVIRKPAVDAIGLNTLHALNSMSPGAVAMSSAPAVNANRGIQLVELMPHQVHQLAQAVSTVLAVDGKVLAGTTNSHNTNAARRGVK